MNASQVLSPFLGRRGKLPISAKDIIGICEQLGGKCSENFGKLVLKVAEA